MPIYHDNRPITAVYHGSKPIARIYRGRELLWSPGPPDHDPVTQMWDGPGRHSFVIPAWAGYLDIVCLGGGAGGHGGNGANAQPGNGGRAGMWQLSQVDVRDFPENVVVAIVGGHGNGGAIERNGTNGYASLVVRGSSDIQVGGKAAGGTQNSGYGSPRGAGTGNRVYNGHNYNPQGWGGDQDQTGYRGGGGGGGGGGIFGGGSPGQPGGNGVIWITARSRVDVEG